MKTAADIVSVIALIFLISGLVVSVFGALSVWRTWAPEGKPFWRDYLRPGRWVKRVIKRAVGRIRSPRDETTTTEGADLSVGFGPADAVASKPFSETEDLSELKREIQQRIDQVDGRVLEEKRRREKAEADLRRAWGAGNEALHAKAHEVATDGLHAEVLALSLLMVGTGLQVASLLL